MWHSNKKTVVLIMALLLLGFPAAALLAGPAPISADDGVWTGMAGGDPAGCILGVWGSSPSDVFAVGCGGDVLHYDGSLWSGMASSTPEDLYGVWGSSATDVWAVGGAIFHYDGDAWSPAIGSMDYLYDVWGSSASDVYAVGSNGTMLHYDGDDWSHIDSQTSKNLNGVWGSSASDVWVVGEDNFVKHYDGSKWTTLLSFSKRDLYGVWGSSASDVWVVGENGTIRHYNGSKWTSISSSPSHFHHGVWSSSASNVFVVGGGYDSSSGTWEAIILHYDGARWQPMTEGLANSLDGIWGSSSSNIFAVGNHGTILHYGGPPVPPAAVDDLAAAATTTSSVTLTWTAPGDDGDKGTASSYDIRYSTAAITEANWVSASQCEGEPAPRAAGSAETFNVTGLSPDTTYHFGIKTADEIPNWSEISNVAITKTEKQDTTPPTVTLTSTVASPTRVSPVTVTATFSEAVTGFTMSDITLGNGVAGNFMAVSTAVYRFDVTPAVDGTVTVDVAAAVAQDAAANGNTAATRFSLVYDSISPSVTLASALSSPTHTSPIALTATFSENVTGFTMSDVTISNGVTGNFVSVNPAIYTFDVTPAGDGAVTVDIAADVAQDAAANGNTAATRLTIDYRSATPDETAPTLPQVSDDGESMSSTTEIHAKWSSADPESGIVEYMYAVGTTQGGSDVVNWTTAGSAVEATAGGLALEPGWTYYVSVKARNGQGLWSEAGSSNGISVSSGKAEREAEKEAEKRLPFWTWIMVGAGAIALAATGIVLWRTHK